nr:MAG: hypothetical protein [Caudoviricetes sp.]
MFDYNILSPNRRAFVDTALEVFPDLPTTITSKQIDQVVAAKGISYPQWFIVESNRESRGVYHFPTKVEVQTITETDEEISIRIADTYESMEALVSSVASNTVNSLIIAGAAGIGKSHTVNKVLTDINYGSEYNFTIHKGYLRATHLFRMLWENRHSGMTIVIDDCDAIFSDETALNILKAALELKPVRRIGWGSEKEFLDEDGETIPRYFDYEGSIIFLTNLPIRELIASGNKNAPHLSALESRSLVLDMKIKTRREYLIKIKQTVNAGMLRDKGFSKTEETQIMDYIEQHKESFTELSLRMVEKVSALFKANPSNWEKLVRAVCMK